MDVRQLEYFIAVCEQGSFSAAVDVLDISQPSLSRHIQRLESELGLHLFRRTGRGMEPTSAGVRLLAHAYTITRAVRAAADDLHRFREQQAGSIRLGLPPRISRRVTPLLVKRFRDAFPGAVLNIKEGLSVEMYDWLTKGRIDIALLYDPPPSDLLSYRPVFREALVLAYADSYRPLPPPTIQAEELGAFPLVLPSAPNSIRALVDKVCRELGIHLDIVAEVDLVHSVGETTLQGQVCSVLPRSEVEDPAHRGRFRYSVIQNPSILNNLVIAAPVAEARVNRLNDGVSDIVHHCVNAVWPEGSR